MKWVAMGALTLALAVPASAQDPGLARALGELPASLPLNKLGANWHRMTVKTSDPAKNPMADMLQQLMQIGMMANQDKKGGKDDAAAMAGLGMLGALFGGGEKKDPVYYSQGTTLQIGGETFLVAYSFVPPETNPLAAAAAAAAADCKEPDLEKLLGASKLSAESELTLSLLNVRTIGTISGIRAFNMEREIAESAKSGGGGLMDLFGNAMQQAGNEAENEANFQEASLEHAIFLMESNTKSDPQLKARGNSIQVTEEDGALVLRGQVTSANLKARATNLARAAIKEAGGSQTVRNHLVVKPAGRR